MKSLPWTASLIVLFLVLASTYVVSENLQRERILIVNGADPASGFTRRVDIGLRRVFQDVENKTIRWVYMGTEAAPDLNTERRLGSVALQRAAKFKPTVIIAVGDDALEYVGRFYVGRRGVAVVYAGISGSLKPYGFGLATNVTGITMTPPFGAVRDVLMAANSLRSSGRMRRVCHLTVDRGNYEHWESSIERFDWRPLRFAGSSVVSNFDDWKKSVGTLGAQCDAIVTGLHEGLRRSPSDSSPVTAQEVVTWSQAHSVVPLLGLDASFAQNGGAAAIGPSPYEEGRVAAELALEILRRHVPAASIGARHSKEYVVALRRRAMLRYHFALPDVYEALAQASDLYYE